MQSSNRTIRVVIILLAVMLSSASCTGEKKGQKHEKRQAQNQSPYIRDWNRFPAIVERRTRAEVIALGDIHGGYERLVSMLSTGGLIKRDQQSPVGYSWSGGNRILVCTGDLIDKGDHSLDVLNLMIALEAQAPASSGEVVTTLGNHEAEFLADPENKKAQEFRAELQSKGIAPATLPQGQRPYGEWMMNRPFAAKINDWFFAHGGNTSGKTVAELAAGFRRAVERGDWGASLLIGDDSLLEAQKWWEEDGKSKALLDQYLAALGVRHIVFGHDPGAFHSKGEIGQEKDGRIFLIDVGMSPAIDYSKGALLLINTDNNGAAATSLDADGRRKELWRAPSSNLAK
ncbi:MAG: metallophosphoesterase [Blastocatellia bacterium]